MTNTTDLWSSLQAALGAQYRIERQLGHGGMGVVFLARDITLDRPVAIKVVHPDLAVHPSIVQRFLAEARMIARLRHPNIIPIHSAGETTGLFYYIMDYVPGESLRQRLTRETRLDPAAAAAILTDLADALDASGRAGLVHRDVKPENVLLDSTTGRAMLADFGIARVMVGDAAEAITGRGLAIGTPTYMSPEQAAGDPVDSRSDLYALGVVGYEMLAGHPPFRGANSAAIASMHLSEPPLSLGMARPGTPPELVGAIMMALEKNPADRWQTGADFRSALLGAPVERGLAHAGSRPKRRRWWLAGALAGAALIAAVTLATRAASGPPRGVNPRHSILVLPFENLRRDPVTDWLREGSVNMLTLNLAQWNDLTVVDHERLHDLFAKQKIRPGEEIGLEMARTLARDAGVWTVVLGDFAEAGDSLRLTARVFDVSSGNRIDLEEVAGRGAPDVRPLFDQLASKLLNLSGAPGAIHAEVASATTTSLEAYRAYLNGIEELNRWDLTAAEHDLAEAVRQDSTFGLAYYKYALARGWIVGPTDSIASDMIVRASRHSTRLPSRDQTMIKAYRAFLEKDFVASRDLYRSLLIKDSTDADAWYGLGDVFFHDTSAARRYSNWTGSLRAFKHALALDPGYYLAYEHTSWLLNRSARSDPEIALLPGDSLAPVFDSKGHRLIDSAQVDGTVRRARPEALAESQRWVASQPETPRAHSALIESYVASRDYRAASGEVDRMGQAVGKGSVPYLPFVRARVTLASGQIDKAEKQVLQVLDSLTPHQIAAATPREVFDVVASSPNASAFSGHLESGARVVDATAQIHQEIYGDHIKEMQLDPDFWRRLWLAHLYGSVGGPKSELRRIWNSAAEAARKVPAPLRGEIARSGWPAALALYTEQGDPMPLKELQSLTGEVQPREIQAMLAVGRRDSSQARHLLEQGSETLDSVWEKRGLWSAYRGPIAAEARFLLGDYREALDLLRDFQPSRFETGMLDPRWGLLGRVRLLRGLAYEKLGQFSSAEVEYRALIDQWKTADPAVQGLVNKARLGLARVSESG